MIKIDLNYLKELSHGDHDFIVEMLETYVEETSKDITAIEQCFQDKNLERISFLAHRCKAAFRMLGLEGLTIAAETVEKGAKVENALEEDFKEPIQQIIRDAKTSFEHAKELIENQDF